MRSGQTQTLKRFTVCVFVTIFALAAFSQTPGRAPKSAAPKAAKIDFARQVQPILEKNCYPCHSARKAMGQLRLDARSYAMQGGISGPVIIPGNSQASLLMQRLLGLNKLARMPLGGEPLTQIQIDLLKLWIDQGAVWDLPSENLSPPTQVNQTPKHWAYQKPVRPHPPEVKNSSWVRNPIDQFILSRLEKEGLQPSREANPETLIRRLYLDLTGLVPSPEEVDRFLADKDPRAFEQLVDRLLATQQYGERWTRPWLDLSRFADTNGYEKDNRRVMWKYRDWVINALNSDMPFDQFTIEQIAGDMLPNATLDQQIATGFHRNTLLNQEGGVDPAEARWETLVDRVNTTATVWLGSTIGCAQCHNHKYDPFTQKDFYRLLAFFDNSDYEIQGNPLERWTKEPALLLPTPEQAAKRDAYSEEITGLEKLFKNPSPELLKLQEVWENDCLTSEQDWTVLEPLEFRSKAGAGLTKLSDNSLLVYGTLNPKDTYTIVANTKMTGITGIRIEALPDASLPRGGPGRDPYGNFSLHGFEVQLSPQEAASNVTGVVFSDAASDEGTVKNLITGNSAGWKIEANLDPARLPRQAVFIPDKPLGALQGTRLEITLKHNNSLLNQTLGRFRLSVTTAKNPAAITYIAASLRPLLKLPKDQRTAEQKTKLTQYFLGFTPSLKAKRERLSEVKKSLALLDIESAEILREKPTFERPSTYMRNRGSFTSLGEKVYAGVPMALHPLSEDQMPNRLGLARWLVDRENPLVARVVVNRFWEQIFGRGIVETCEDFGTQGQRPSHPELLDYLATEFMQGAGGAKPWSMKAIIRLMVTSATYRQSSNVPQSLLERDPYNRLLARGPRFRLEAEMIRDVSLGASGLLNLKVGGPSVYPIQPEGIWNGPYNSDRWQTSKGGEQFRRALYTFIRRTAPYPMFTTFDAPSRELCLVRRLRTNTPLQALTTLNDEAFFVAARALALKVLRAGGQDLPSRIIYGFRLCTSRHPYPQEVERLEALYQRTLAKYAKDPASAKLLLKADAKTFDENRIGELAAWTVLANVLLNMDETITKE